MQGSDSNTFDAISKILEIFFIAVFALLFLLNLVVGIKYKVYENTSSLFITTSLMLLDLLRLITFVGTSFYT